jgi:hypothetical protein
MGTRADFYIGIDKDAEWLGSIAFDGGEVIDDIKKGFEPDILDEEEWRQAIKAFLDTRDDATYPEMGWPWPWDNSSITDVAYGWHDDAIYMSWGETWLKYEEYIKKIQTAEHEEVEEYEKSGIPTDWPDMSSRKNVRWDKGSGLIILGG